MQYENQVAKMKDFEHNVDSNQDVQLSLTECHLIQTQLTKWRMPQPETKTFFIATLKVSGVKTMFGLTWNKTQKK